MNKAMTDVLKDKRKTFLFVFLAIALVLATWYKLKIQGITMTDDVSYEEVLICENTDETHVHSAECYEKVAVTSSDKQEEINQSEEQKQDTTDTNLEESEEQKENEQDENVNQQLEQNNETDSQENIPEDTGQKEIAEDMDSNDIMTANVFALSGGTSTYAVTGSISTSNNDVNICLYIDGNWTSIGYIESSEKHGVYRINTEDVTDLINNYLGSNINLSDFKLYYSVSGNDSFSQASTNDSGNKYKLGSNVAYKNLYVTDGITNSDANTESKINAQNTFKVYSIKEYSETDSTTPVSTKYVYTTSSDGKTTYTLSSEHNYYVNNSTEVVPGGTTIDITGPTTLKQVPAPKCTVTIIHVDGTITTQEVSKGSTYTLGSNLKWKVGDSTELTDGGTQITVNEDITVTESNQITIIYTVDTSTNATGIDAKYLYDGIAIPTVQGSNTYTTTITYSDGTIIEDLSDKYVTPYNSEATISKDRIVLEFTGWKVNNTSTTINAQTELTWSELYNYAQNGVINLNTIWSRIRNNRNYVNFYIRYDSVAVDTDGNITSQATDKYTPSLWASYVGNESLAENIADTTSDNSYTANKNIRALEGVKENAAYIYSEPTDEYVLSQLKIYADYLSIDGESVPIDELDMEHYEVRWYVFKIQNDCWHIDGKLVRKEGKMVVSKTFTGSKAAIEAVTGYSFETNNTSLSSNYYLEMIGGDTTTNLYLSDASLVNGTTEQNGVSTYELTYTWVVDVKYGINYTITEKNYNIDNYITNTIYNIVDPESTKYKKVYNADGTYYYDKDADGNFITTYTNQSKGSTTSDRATVMGVNNYAIDSSETIDNSKIINVNFTNTYAPTSAITIKKDDSVTNNGLANAQFSLYEVKDDGSTDENVPLKFTYNESIYTYNENGSITVLTSPSGGSIIIDGLPSGKTYKLVEISVPDGYDGNSSVEVTLTAQGDGVIVPVITKGTGKDYDTTNKILEVDNASKLTDVKVTKKWQDVSEEYIKDVIVELYLNNIPISNYNLNYDLNGDGTIDDKDVVQKQVVLNSENSWTYTWDNLPLYVDGSKAIYTVREVQIGEIKAVTNGQYNSETGTWESYDAYTQYRAHTTAQTETKDSDGNVTQVSFDLINTIHLVKININKISPLGVAIDGVKFKLQKVDDSGNIDSTFEARELITSSDGKLSFVDLEYNTKYVITEIEGNKGYYLDSTPIYVIINKGEQGQEDTLTLYTDNTFTTEAVAGDYEYVSLNDAKDTLNIINISHTPMPKAGGCGVYSFYILGILLMGCSTIIIYLRKNKIKKGK